MPTAVISDVHGNAAALGAVLGDIAKRKIDRILCLGDTVGYGPEPLKCIDLVREKCAWSLMGNHDFAVLYEPTNFNAAAESATYWTRDQFDKEPDAALRAARYDYLGRLRVRVVEQLPGMPFPILAVHGSPRRPVNEYIFAEDPENVPEKMAAIFERVEHLCVVGHTHVAGVFTPEPEFFPPDELGKDRSYPYREGEKAVINVGSVGQPRDKDPRASYVVLHDDRAEFVRVAYDIEETAGKIRAIPQLPDWLAERLYKGQ